MPIEEQKERIAAQMMAHTQTKMWLCLIGVITLGLPFIMGAIAVAGLWVYWHYHPPTAKTLKPVPVQTKIKTEDLKAKLKLDVLINADPVEVAMNVKQPDAAVLSVIPDVHNMPPVTVPIRVDKETMEIVRNVVVYVDEYGRLLPIPKNAGFKAPPLKKN